MDGPTVWRGVLAGLAATGAMTLLELPVWSRWGMEGLLEWQENQAIAARVGRRSLDPAVVPGLVLHGLHGLHGSLAGAVFVLALPFLSSRPPLWILGPGYGVVLFAIALVIHKPITGRPPWSGSLKAIPLVVSFLAHLVYGAALALLVVWP